MKKIIFVLALTIMSINVVKAFDIDVNKIELNSRTSNLTSKLNKTYNIDIEDFDKKIISDPKVEEFSKKLTNISLSKDSIQKKKEQMTDYLYISSDNGFDTLNGSLFMQMYIEQLEKEKIEATKIKDIKTVNFKDNEAMSFVYLADAMVNAKKQDVILVYWLKLQGDEYRLYYPWLKTGDNLNEYFKKVTDNEDKGIVIGESYNQLSLNSESKSSVSTEQLSNIYNDNKDSVVQITGMKGNGSNSYGSGFFIREGVIVTTWSLFMQLLSESNYIYVNDCNGDSYEILGVIAAQTDYDVVILKIDQNAGKGVSFGTATDLKLDDNLFMINSKNNSGFSINYGSFISLNKGRLKNMFLLNSSDVGGALFNSDGKVVGINVSDQLMSELSYANSTDYLKKLQTILNKQDYKKITYTLLEAFKQNYYVSFNEEKTYNNITNDIWNEYKKVGNIEENIKLNLVKGTYNDGILSLRYKTNINETIDSYYLVSNYAEELIKSSYKLTYEDNYKKIYKNNDYKVVIKNNLNYIIILIMEN